MPHQQVHSSPPAQGLYHPHHEHDACGVGFIANIKGNKSHSLVAQGLKILDNLSHRGATGYDPLLGDGAGILIQLPDVHMRRVCGKQGITLPAVGQYGVGMVFLPQEPASRMACEQEIERAIQAEGQLLLGWRDVPTNNEGLSQATIAVEPVIRQVLIGRGTSEMSQDDLERKLYIIRKRSGHAVQALNLRHGKEFYVPSCSTRTVVYKGMLLADQVGKYYTDLLDPTMVTALALVHQRFSTNTFPTWDLAHPFRMVAHNGEINTLRGNVNWIRARQQAIASPILKDDLKKIWPLIYDGQSDSASFDNCLEMLVMGGYSLAHAMMMMIPEAWSGHKLMDEDRKAFYEYHATLMEAWDGPAAMAFTDGRQIGATLDRNGLRPARYILTDDDMVVLASEAGVLDIPEEKIVKKWRLQPGKMFLVDIERGKVIDDNELKRELATAKPYREWVRQARIRLDDLPEPAPAVPSSVSLLDRQQAFGYSQEDLKVILVPMAQNGIEPTGSMGNDSPLAVMSDKPRNLYHYFKQLFAQVTNPPIDPIREELVMSTAITIGPRPNLLDIHHTDPGRWLEVPQPVLTTSDMEKIRHIDLFTGGYLRSEELDITYPAAWGPEGIEAAMASLCAHAEDAIRLGFNLMIVTDRLVNAERVAIPALLAVAGIHQHLVRKGLRTSTGLVVETGSAREVHHFALLGGYGAAAVHPYLALETLHNLNDYLGDYDKHEAEKKYIRAVSKGLLKVMSKMGISTYQSYCGAQIFEAVGLSSAFVNQYFTGTASNVEGIGIFEIAEEAMRLHTKAFGDDPVLRTQLDAGGEYAFRVRGEEHMWTPEAIAKLQHSTRKNSYDTYKEYAKIINDQTKRHMTLRGLFELKPLGPAIPLDEVEPAKEIVKRFATGAMSLGSISTEAHATLALAMNRIGGKSNTGEGGEDPKRSISIQKDGETLKSKLGDAVVADIPLYKGDSLRSKIKQVASARFGVTAEYLQSADQIQIKMAQGAKPGEGGQLPGHKVSEYIGKLRFSTPGVELISPPPHHDIYSIEDLAQLIHDLKNANSAASISVKLVSEVGVGTVAAGVAKAKADHVTIAGHDGGTGASPVSSIKHAGTPWELGLAETQQTLVLNRLRGRIAVQVDGQLKTGRDVVIGALLGADEFGFATAPLVVEGCIMMRKCHLNTCPVGVATQDPDLRKKFSGQPEHVVNYFFFVAEEAREIMASLGVRSFNELIGRADLLDTAKGISHWKAKGLDFSRIFHMPAMPKEVARLHNETQDHGLDGAIDNQLIAEAKPALEKQEKVVINTTVRNLNRTVGAMLSGDVARRFGHDGLTDDTITVKLTGTAGQSFGAFLANGVTLDLTGQANDYVGKGLSGGKIVVRPNAGFKGDPTENIIVGNTVMYGATAGEAYFRGVAGERFCVRNSGASAVVEGTGDHGCEYMTGGTVVVLGATGRNFAAGMSGGVAYVLDEDGQFEKRCNMAMVGLDAVADKASPESHLGRADIDILMSLIEHHARYTGSERAKTILANWAVWLPKFVKVMPTEYRRALKELAAKKSSLTQKAA
ncbi:MAG: glutamate synthase subunit alpha [Rhodocyclaceae bacterium]|nr:glutamate synthase subunit alpha [Rhodocyclaceae bacterium]MCA3025929.1 glutamate synthase subunit alpha [Rhodocyclaceae bacterium]MCA3031039.1 glutamate synthase subunit alpha [Rhodocyclaceae bacterium]MCA3036275.1 glutamate synthase subunit alpha [Rhodocyclaceae bacterium]MCA3039509.1 glutamate synthase subunit alpha [Rhodocyclaceae bacterium]